MIKFSRKRVAPNSPAFKRSWEEEYFFTEHNGAVKCLVCSKVLNQLKRYNLRRHYGTFHSKNYEHLTYEQRLSKIEILKATLGGGTSTFGEDNFYKEFIVQPSSSIPFEIQESPCIISEIDYVKEDLTEIEEQKMCSQEIGRFETIYLPIETDACKIKETTCDLLDRLGGTSDKFLTFSLALDESTDISGTPQMAIFIRGVDTSLHITEELLDLIPLKESISGEDIFKCVEQTLENNNLDWSKLVSVATDGAPAMIEKNNGFIGQLKKKLNNIGVPHEVAVIHSLIHRQNLCAKSIELSRIMSVIVPVIKYIKSHGIQEIQFLTFLHELDVEYGDLAYHTDVRWLSRGKVLDNFFNICGEIAIFMESMGKPIPELRDTQWLMDLAFLSDLLDHLNTLNSSLRKEGKLIVELYDSFLAFMEKLNLWAEQLATRNIFHFPKLKSLVTDEINLNKYVDILGILHKEFKFRCESISNLNTDFNIFAIPFSVDIESVPPVMQLELIEMRCDRILEDKFSEVDCLLDFYRYVPQIRFPHLYYCATRILSMFGSTHVCEQFFSNMKRTNFTYGMEVSH